MGLARRLKQYGHAVPGVQVVEEPRRANWRDRREVPIEPQLPPSRRERLRA
ncbi:hypothetical protein K4749_21575 [Streptomyces sp. TRM72054]|nr:hypothetical protein [Streptomyces sp. TRM72054]MBX9396121.1 hypothetical protein [Streptomyces sp. TRM72054]